MNIKLTFKKHPKETGLAAVGNRRQCVDIKMDKKIIGLIAAPNWSTEDQKYGVSVAVESSDSWKWLFCKKRCETEQQARELAPKFVEYLISKGHTIHKFED